MKSSTVWHGHSTRPSLPAGTARKASGHLSGRRPLHLANARPFGRLKAPLGLSLLRCAAQTRACLWQAEQAHHAPSKEKQSVPDGERPVVHIAIVCGFNRKFYKQSNSQRPACDMQFTVVVNESNRELRWQGASECWVSVKQFSRNDTATALSGLVTSTRLGRGSIKSHVCTVKVLGMGLFAFQERVRLWQGVTH